MATIDIDHIDVDTGYEQFNQSAEELSDGAKITVGIHAEDAGRTDGIEMNNAELMMLHSFGGVVEHPGGTPYVITDEGPQFVAENHPDPDGHTDPHRINIPPRPALRGGLQEERGNILGELTDGLGDYMDGDIPLRTVLGAVGQKARSAARDWFGSKNKLIDNAPETIRRKGHDRPMIGHTAQLRGAIDYKVDTAGLKSVVPKKAKKSGNTGGWSGLIEG